MLRLKAETGELKEAFGGFIAKVAEDTGIVRLMTEALVEWRMIAAQGHDADNTAQGKRSEEYQAITKEVGNTAEVLKGLKKDLDTAEKTGILPDGFFRIEELRKAVADMSAILTDAKKRRAEMLGLHLEAGEAEAGIVTKGETSKDPTGKVKTAKEIADEVERIKKDSLDRQIRMGNAFEDEKKKQRDEEWMAVDAERDQMKEWEKEMAMGADFAKAAQKEKVREIEESAKTLDEVLERGAEEAKRAKRYYEQAGTSIGYSFASALSSTIETAISGGDTGMAIADGILSIAGSFTDFLPFPLNVLIKSALGIGKAVVHAGAKRMDQDGGRTKGPGYRHNGGWVDDSGPYFHDGGWPGLRPDEVPIIAQKGERVLNRQESLEYTRGSGGGRGSITMNINAVDAKSVRELLTGEGGRGFYNAVRTGRGMLPQLIRGT
jgi:broad specificity phosphatase PhoE